MTQPLEGTFNPSVHFLGLLKKAVTDGIARRCAVSGGPQIVVAPKQMAYYSAAITTHELGTLCLAEPFDLQIETLSDWDPDARKETIQVGRMRLKAQGDARFAGLSPKPLGELLWLASVVASRGRLLQGCRADDPIRLKQWPDFTVLPHRESDLRLAQFMYENTADLLTVSERTGVPLTHVYDFYNGCAALGLIERGNVFDPQDYFLGLVLICRRDGLIRRCTLPNLPPLFLVPKERRYYSTLEGIANLLPFFPVSLSEMQVDTLDRLEVGEPEEETIQIGRMFVRRKKEKPTTQLQFGSLDELLWNAALHASHGRLLAGKQSSDIVRLRRWPEFSRLPHHQRWLPLAAFMSANATDLPSVARCTGTPLPQVIDFHNACAVLDYLEYLPEQQLHAKLVTNQERELYQTISKSLGGIKAAPHA